MIRFFKTPFVFRYLFSKREWGFSDSKAVCLTFDDGPTEELTTWILDFLKKEGIQATFFCVGENVEKHPEIFFQDCNFFEQLWLKIFKFPLNSPHFFPILFLNLL